VAAVLAVRAFGQAAGTPAFDAADVRISKPGTSDGDGFIYEGRAEFLGSTMLDIIAVAWDIDTDRVIGGPSWLSSNRYDISATAKPGTPDDEMRSMLRALLVKRFHLATHKEDRELPAYELAVAKSGAKLKESTGSEPGECSQTRESPGSVVVTCQRTTVAELLDRLQQTVARQYVDHPAVDKTGLKGRYDFTLNWTPRPMLRKDASQAEALGGPNLTLFDALERQLGLQLTSSTRPGFVVVVDRVDEKPAESSGGDTRSLPPAPKEFDVAAVHPAPPGSTEEDSRLLPSGQVELRGLTMQELIDIAYHTTPDRIAGAPKWLDSDRFDIVAKTAPSTPIETIMDLLKALLADRFKLVTHNEDRVTDVYALTVQKRAPKLTEAAANERSECRRSAGDGALVLTCKSTTMAQLADKLPQMAPAYFDHPMVDLTGLAGAYDFTLSWAPKGVVMPAAGRGGDAQAPAGVAATSPDPTGALTVFEAVDRQLGLKLSAEKHSMPMLVVDSVERTPAEN
jgi:uncharacterized protein (TIGR03435 family)